MGNHHSHGEVSRTDAGEATSDSAGGGSLSGSRKEKSLSRSASGADLQESKFSTHLLPIDKLAKILVRRTQQEEHVQGITETVFAKYVFPRYSVLAEKLFSHFRTAAKSRTPHLSLSAFRQQSERFLGILEDALVVETYVRMYCSEQAEDEAQLSPDALKLLLMTAYSVAMDHYSDGPQMCLQIQRTLATVADSCFHRKRGLSAQYVSHWLLGHCPRLLLPLHRYVVHRLATSHRTIEAETETGAPEQAAAGIELATPVLEQPPPFGAPARSSNLLPISLAWLLAGALPPLYSRPRECPSPAGTGPSFLSRLIAAVPSHWVRLYCADQHGRGANRFQHHVLAYRGPTLVLLEAQCGAVFCVAAASEWHESHLYWGGEDSAVLLVYPRFALLERGPKMLFLNTSIRGYPKGLRAGKDPRKPLISIDGGFDKMECQSVPYVLSNVEVWGCGDATQRETQLDIKKWQVKEAERQRNVKLSAADWLDHPDRYLLELAGRPQYNNGQTPPQ